MPLGCLKGRRNVAGLERALKDEWQLAVDIKSEVDASDSITDDEVVEKVATADDAVFESKLDIVGREQFTPFMRMVMLQSINSHWREHLAALDYLRQGIHLRGYAQKNQHPDARGGGRGGGGDRAAGQRAIERDLYASERGWQCLVRRHHRRSCTAGGRCAQGRAQRSLPLWQWEEVQGVPRALGLTIVEACAGK